jgi:hypothetical protein
LIPRDNIESIKSLLIPSPFAKGVNCTIRIEEILAAPAWFRDLLSTETQDVILITSIEDLFWWKCKSRCRQHYDLGGIVSPVL